MNVEKSTVGTKKSRQPKRQKSLELAQSRQSLTTVRQPSCLSSKWSDSRSALPTRLAHDGYQRYQNDQLIFITSVLSSLVFELISEDRRSISCLRPTQRRNRVHERIRYQICTNEKTVVEFLSKFQDRGIKIARVNSILVAKPLFFLNILRAIAPWVTSSWAIVLFELNLCLPSLVNIPCITSRTCWKLWESFYPLSELFFIITMMNW